jgi:hypothetical protein
MARAANERGAPHPAGTRVTAAAFSADRHPAGFGDSDRLGAHHGKTAAESAFALAPQRHEQPIKGVMH